MKEFINTNSFKCCICDKLWEISQKTVWCVEVKIHPMLITWNCAFTSQDFRNFHNDLWKINENPPIPQEKVVYCIYGTIHNHFCKVTNYQFLPNRVFIMEKFRNFHKRKQNYRVISKREKRSSLFFFFFCLMEKFLISFMK